MASPSWITAIIKQMTSFGFTYNIKNNAAHVKIPSPKLWASWEGDNLDHAFLIKMLFGCRTLAFYTPPLNGKLPYLEYPSVIGDNMTFMKCSNMEITRPLLKMNAYPDLYVTLEVANIGKSSFSTINELVDADNIYYKNISTILLIDKVSRKRIFFPDWWRAKYKPINELNNNVANVTKPCSYYKYDLVIRPQDTDINNHTNFTSYLSFCKSALNEAFNNHVLDHLKNTVLSERLISILYIKETFLDEKLNICLWEGDMNNKEINFHIERNDELVCQVIITF